MAFTFKLMKSAIFVAVVLLVVGCEGAMPRIYSTAAPMPGQPTLIDEYGRYRIFHGFNDVQKGFPWYPKDMLNTTRIQLLQDLGMNAVRLGMMWSGAQPSMNEWNTSYYSTMSSIVDSLAQHGIYSLLDMHQDGMSSKFCLYDGLPLWVVNLAPPPQHPFPWPFPANSSCGSRPWGANYLTEAASAAFQALYSNTNHMMDYMSKFWAYTAASFKEKEGLLGYELINEPFAGNIYEDPALLLPGLAGSQNLAPLYEAVAAAIRAVDDSHLVFYEPVTWGMIFDNEIVGSGFSQVPGGPAYANRSVFSFHYYCWLYAAEANGSYAPWSRAACDEGLGPQVMAAVAEDLQTLGGGAFLTEFGTCDLNTAGGREECLFVVGQAENYSYSWTSWDYSDGRWFDDNGALRPEAVEVYVRPYPQAIAGNVSSTHYNVTAKTLQFCYFPTPLEQSLQTMERITTEVFVPVQYVYKAQHLVEVSLTPGLCACWEGNHLLLTPKQQGVCPPICATSQALTRPRPSPNTAEECVTIAPLH